MINQTTTDPILLTIRAKITPTGPDEHKLREIYDTVKPDIKTQHTAKILFAKRGIEDLLLEQRYQAYLDEIRGVEGFLWSTMTAPADTIPFKVIESFKEILSIPGNSFGFDLGTSKVAYKIDEISIISRPDESWIEWVYYLTRKEIVEPVRG